MRLCPFDGGPVVPEPELDGETVTVPGRSPVALAPADVSVDTCLVCGRRWLIEP